MRSNRGMAKRQRDVDLRFTKPPPQLALWLGLAWLGLAWLGLAWFGLAWLGKDCILLLNITHNFVQRQMTVRRKFLTAEVGRKH